MKLKAEDKGGYYLLNGSKMWITNGPDADTLVVYAKSEPPRVGRARRHRLPDRKGMKGFPLRRKLDKLGMRGSHTGELVFQTWKSRPKHPGRPEQRRQGADERPGLRARHADRRPWASCRP